MSFFECDDKLVDEQNGFRHGRSCEDHLFVLSSNIRNNVSEEKSIYAAFIDFKNAFATMNRDMLLYKILENGIQDKVYYAIK